jgi:hypothetical protein
MRAITYVIVQEKQLDGGAIADGTTDPSALWTGQRTKKAPVGTTLKRTNVAFYCTHYSFI